MMKFLALGAVCLALSVCVPAHAQDYLPMPDEFIRNWDPLSQRNFTDMEISPNGIVEKDVKYSNTVYYRNEYKVFDTDDTGVYAIVLRQVMPEYALSDFDYKLHGTPEEQKQRRALADRIMQPHFEYWHFSVEPYADRTDVLIVRNHNCNLLQKNWDASALQNKENFKQSVCAENFSQHTWSARVKNTGSPKR